MVPLDARKGTWTVLRYISERVLQLLLTLLGISIVVFLVLRVVPGDPAIAMLGEQADPARLADVRHRLGLDQPLPVQYLVYVKGAVVGDLGSSILTGQPVAPELIKRFPATLELALVSLGIAVVVGIPLGVIAALRRGEPIDTLAMMVSLGGISTPLFWLGLMLIWVFSVKLGVLPVHGRISPGVSIANITGFYVLDSIMSGDWRGLTETTRHLILPAVALSAYPLGQVARITRSNVLEVLSKEYVRTARAKGLRQLVVIGRHALPNAMIPVVTVLGLQLGRLLGGAVVTEIVFSWPGVGRFVVNGVMLRDYPVVQGGVMVITACFALINLFVDLSYCFLDPRIRYG